MIIGQLTLGSGVSGYLDFFIQDAGSFNVTVEVITEAALSTVVLYSGTGGRDPSIPYPYEQLVPHTGGINEHGTTVVNWDLKGTSYSLSSLLSNRQSVSISVQKSLSQPWVSIGIPTTSAATQINVHM